MKKLFVIILALVLLPLFSNFKTNASPSEFKEIKTRTIPGDAISACRIISREGNEVTFEIDYTVDPSHGETVYIGGWIYDDNGRSFGAYKPSAIPNTGTGTAKLVIILDRSSMIPKEVEFFLFEPSKKPFIKRRFPVDLKAAEKPGVTPPPKIKEASGYVTASSAARPKPENKWEWIGAQAKTIITGGGRLYMVNSTTADIYQYNGSPGSWTRIGGPGHSFVANLHTIYALSMDRGGIYEYMGKPEKWVRIHGAARAIYAGGTDLFFADAETGDIYKYNPKSTKNVKYDVEGPVKIGGPGYTFAVDPFNGSLYGLSPDRKGIYAYTKSGQWKKIGESATAIFAGPNSSKDFHTVYVIHAKNNNLHKIFYTEKHDRIVGGPAPEKLKQTRIGGPSAEFSVGQFDGTIWGLSPDRSGIYEADPFKANKDGSYPWKKIGGPAMRIFGGGKCIADKCSDQLYVIDSEHNVWRYLGQDK